LEGGQHFSEVTVFLATGEETRMRGPARRNKQEALKDCLELRKVAIKCGSDPSLLAAFPDMCLRQVRQRKKELEDIVWTVKDLGGRLLEGAEGPPPFFTAPPSWSSGDAKPAPAASAAAARAGGAAGKFRGMVKGKEASVEAVVEVADLQDAVPEKGGDWESRAKVALQQACKRFGPVMEVKLDAGDGPEEIATVRFASMKAAETCMVKAAGGFLAMGERHVRVRQPTAAESVWRKFPSKRNAPAMEAPNKKKLRPNERFATKIPGTTEEPDESEKFWEQAHDKRGHAAEPPPSAAPPPPVEAPPPEAPEKPEPTKLEPGASEEDLEVCKGEEEVAKEMAVILEKPFSQQKKALKKLRLAWHPDKNAERKEVATRVFQFIQSHEQWLAHHDLS